MSRINLGSVLGCSVWVGLIIYFISGSKYIETFLIVMAIILVIGFIVGGGGGSKYGNDEQN